MRAERGGIVTGWLLKLVVSIAIVGLVSFEAGAIVVARVTVEETARKAAEEAAATLGRTDDPDASARAAREAAERDGATLDRFEVLDGGRAVAVTVHKRARTLFLQRLGPTEDWTIARSTRRRLAS